MLIQKIILSSASAWEIATKYRIGKLPEAKQLVEEYSQILHQAKFMELAIELESLPIITYDEAFQTGLIQVIPSVK
ncbi:MAG: hypothetical protein U7126_23745 [Microcoleus sp.]